MLVQPSLKNVDSNFFPENLVQLFLANVGRFLKINVAVFTRKFSMFYNVLSTSSWRRLNKKARIKDVLW
jgi:hypothetical protein